MNKTHDLTLTRVVKRGTKHVTNQIVSIKVQIDVDGEINTPSKIPFCDGEKITPLDESLPFYSYSLLDLINAQFDEIKITPLKNEQR